MSTSVLSRRSREAIKAEGQSQTDAQHRCSRWASCRHEQERVKQSRRPASSTGCTQSYVGILIYIILQDPRLTKKQKTDKVAKADYDSPLSRILAGMSDDSAKSSKKKTIKQPRPPSSDFDYELDDDLDEELPDVDAMFAEKEASANDFDMTWDKQSEESSTLKGDSPASFKHASPSRDPLQPAARKHSMTDPIGRSLHPASRKSSMNKWVPLRDAPGIQSTTSSHGHSALDLEVDELASDEELADINLDPGIEPEPDAPISQRLLLSPSPAPAASLARAETSSPVNAETIAKQQPTAHVSTALGLNAEEEEEEDDFLDWLKNNVIVTQN